MNSPAELNNGRRDQWVAVNTPGLMAPTTANDLRRANRLRVLRLVRRHGPVSRAEIAERSGLSRAALTAIAQDLLDEGVLVEGARVQRVQSSRFKVQGDERCDVPEGSGARGAPADGANGATGRRAGVGLSFNADWALAIGVELTEATLHGVVVDLAGNVRAERRRAFAGDAEPRAVVARLIDLVQELNADTGGTARGVGLAASGQVDPAAGISLSIPGMPRWRDVPLRQEVEHLTGLPVRLDWRVNAATLAEQWYGAAREADDFAYVNVSDGVGMGLVLGGAIQRGWRSLAGGLGHVPVPAPADLVRTCVCGNAGCLQTFVSVPSIVQRVERALDDGVDSALLHAGTAEAPLAFEHVLAAAHNGDKLALTALEDAADYLGRGVAIVVNMLNPPLVVIGGAIARADEIVMPPLARAARRWSRTRAFEGLPLVMSRLRPDAAVVGAATLILQHVLGDTASAVPQEAIGTW